MQIDLIVSVAERQARGSLHLRFEANKDWIHFNSDPSASNLKPPATTFQPPTSFLRLHHHLFQIDNRRFGI